MPDIAVLSGGDGGFAVDTPYRGRYALMIYADGHRPAHVNVELRDSGESVPVEVELESAPH